MKYLRIFEEWNSERFASKEDQKNYYRDLAASKPVEDRIISADQLNTFDIPQEIIDKMSEWDVIVKSPHSDSFYNSKEISWSSKPDKSFRVSDHWNFEARGSKHCITKTHVKNDSHVSLGQYDKKSGKYTILLSLPSPAFVKKQEFAKKKIDYMRSPEVLASKKDFKNKVLNKEIHCEIEDKGQVYKGIVRKYTGHELKIENDKGQEIYNNNYLEDENIKLFDKDGNLLKDPFDVKFESRIYSFKTFESVSQKITNSHFTEEELKDIEYELQPIIRAFNIKQENNLNTEKPTSVENKYCIGAMRNAYVDMVLFSNEEDIINELKSFVIKMETNYGLKVINGWMYRNNISYNRDTGKGFEVGNGNYQGDSYKKISIVFHNRKDLA